MATPYNPGCYPPREFSPDKYNPRQEGLYQAYRTAYYALYEGRLGTLRPTPGFSYSPEALQTWKEKFVAGGKAESASRGKYITRPIVESDYPDHVWVWMYQQMLLAEEL